MKTYEELLKENAALTAHVERLNEVFYEAHTTDQYPYFDEWLRELRGAFRESPNASLAHLKAHTRRDEVDSILSVIGAYQDRSALLDMLRERSAELRQQAEGGER